MESLLKEYNGAPVLFINGTPHSGAIVALLTHTANTNKQSH
jgi:hypothetical protein